MTLALKIIVIIVVVLALAIAVLRIRKLRRDEIRELSRPVERRLMSPPPSPYTPSKGFRLLDGTPGETRRAQPARPRLESDRDYVFSETQMPSDESFAPPRPRHSEEWALSKSSRRPATFSGLRLLIAVVLVAAAVAVGVYFHGHHSTTSPPTTTTTVRHRASTTTTSAAAFVTSGSTRVVDVSV